MTAVITIQDVRKDFTSRTGERVQALDTIDLTVMENEFLCIVGPSGCGKSTLLRMTAGLESITSGSILYRGEHVTGPRREVGMVFQEYSLLPWRTVKDNVSLGLEFEGKSKEEQRKAQKKYLTLVNLLEFADAMPHELSGGMRQRVAIARALANKPDVLLMDEPFGALDAHTRTLLQKELLTIWQNHKTTILFVTHSVDEAIYLSDRVVVMSARPGRIQTILPVDIPRVRDRANPLYGKMTSLVLNMLDSGQ